MAIMSKEIPAFGLTERDVKTITDAFAAFPEIKEVVLFGSRAKGNFRKGSDIDLAVMNAEVSPKVITALISRFQESSLPYRVDLVYFPELTNPDLMDHIRRVGIRIYKKELNE